MEKRKVVITLAGKVSATGLDNHPHLREGIISGTLDLLKDEGFTGVREGDDGEFSFTFTDEISIEQLNKREAEEARSGEQEAD